MHYRNGRAAKAGDKVIDLNTGIAGILHSTHAQSDTCNGRLAVTTPSDPCVTIKDCMALEDVAAAARTIPPASA